MIRILGAGQKWTGSATLVVMNCVCRFDVKLVNGFNELLQWRDFSF